MPILSPLESRTLTGRLTHLGVIVLLLAIAATTTYPFLVMVSGSLRSEYDAVDLDLIPAFLLDDATLHRKFLAAKYDENPTLAADTLLRPTFSFKTMDLSRTESEPGVVDAARSFLEDPDLPQHWSTLGLAFSLMDVPENMRRLRENVFERYGGDLGALSTDLGTVVEDWALVRFPSPTWANPGYVLLDGPLSAAYFQLLDERPAAEHLPVSLSGSYLRSIVYPTYGTDPAAYNAAHAVPLDSFLDFRLPDRVPSTDEPTARTQWEAFVRTFLNPSFVVIDGLTDAAFAEALRDLGVREAEAKATPAPDGRWLSGRQREAFERLLAAADVEDLRLVGPEFVWAEQHPDLPPLHVAVSQLERSYVTQNAGDLRADFMLRNYRNVWEELTVQGRVLFNTIVFCGSAIVLALLINPLAAYALSRFRLPSTYKVLLFLIATMAFPPMIMMIPQFIMLRNLGLLNTFLGLVLPLMVNGYMIFLLKGFFDALPQELYEAATIDGAGEWRMFFQIAMALSKPILAVLALGTFTSAYTMFLYPLLVAPDRDMWVMSVWLFQFQQRSTSAGVFASVVIASVPTLVIFLLTQRTIMRGIAVPSEK